MNKQLSIALLALGLSSVAFAGNYKDQVVAPVGVNLVAPDTVGIWSFGAEILLMQPANSHFQYGQIRTVDNVNGVVYRKNNAVDSSFTLGGTVDVAYLFPDNARDVKISFTNLEMNDSSHQTIIGQGNNQIYITPFNNMDNLIGNGAAIKGKETQDYASADMVFGQWIRIGQRVDLHPFSGLRYADIDISDQGTYLDTATAITQTSKLSTEFEGIGPRAGIDTSVHLGWGISLVGTVGGALLVGDIDSKAASTNPNGNPVTQNYNNSGHTHVIPELDARIGFNYMYNYTDTSSMSFELGFQDVNYFDVVDTDYLDTRLPNTISNSNDFAYRGWYARFQFNVA